MGQSFVGPLGAQNVPRNAPSGSCSAGEEHYTYYNPELKRSASYGEQCVQNTPYYEESSGSSYTGGDSTSGSSGSGSEGSPVCYGVDYYTCSDDPALTGNWVATQELSSNEVMMSAFNEGRHWSSIYQIEDKYSRNVPTGFCEVGQTLYKEHKSSPECNQTSEGPFCPATIYECM